ncbi:helix-hairpin-helix domain-containing protein [Bacteroides sedimenti]|uniref:Helix-hairpin-helix domain-containing protein n=1 Tax=Bacteroides sedimenti TaxID=2136147 RepID=A0ABN6Z608_9BACE
MEVRQRLFLVVITLFYFYLPISAQIDNVTDWEDLAEEMVSEDEEEDKGWVNWQEDLNYLKENPLNLNQITKEQLEQFPFLSALQIEYLLYYLYLNAPMKSIYELQLVEELDRQTIQYLLPYVFVGEPEKKEKIPSWNDLLNYGKHEILTRFDIPLYMKKGFTKNEDSLSTPDVNKRFIGSSYYHSLRYSFQYKDLLICGLTAEKDCGEPFQRRVDNLGYDYLSFYLLVRNLGKLKTLALGNYRLSFGHGLVINSNYSLGKSSSISTMESKSTGIKKHSSTDEYNYFQGMAATFKQDDFSFTGFYSYRNLDGIVTDGVLSSIKKDGLHRIPRDVERRNAATVQLTGGNIGYSFHNLKVGITGIYYFFDKRYEPELRPYNYYYLRGKEFFNLGVDYKYRWNKVLFSGETAVGKSGGIATLNSVAFSPAKGYQLLLLQRFYAKDYKALYARSISEGSSVQNENGFYLGVESAPRKYWKLSAYVDFFRFPWLRYEADRPSSGFDGLLQSTYTPKTNLTMFLRYRYKSKDKNYTPEKSGQKEVCPFIQQKVKYQVVYTMYKSLLFKTTADWVWTNPQGVNAKHGYLIFQNISYQLSSLPIRFDLSYGMFDTDDYSTRISGYERNLLYAYSLMTFYGKGVRFAFNTRYDFNRKLMLMAKLGQTRYTDRDEIGSGLDTIFDNAKTDIYLQLRWKF